MRRENAYSLHLKPLHEVEIVAVPHSTSNGLISLGFIARIDLYNDATLNLKLFLDVSDPKMVLESCGIFPLELPFSIEELTEPSNLVWRVAVMLRRYEIIVRINGVEAARVFVLGSSCPWREENDEMMMDEVWRRINNEEDVNLVFHENDQASSYFKTKTLELCTVHILFLFSLFFFKFAAAHYI